MALGWSDEETEIAVTMWQNGHSGSQIAADPRIRRSRNSVIAHIFRLRMKRDDLKPMSRKTVVRTASRRKTPIKAKTKRPDKRLSKPKALPNFPVIDWTAPTITVEVPEGQRRQIGELEANQCRYINGDPREAGWHFCHQTQIPGLPYCEAHVQVCFQPPESQPVRRQVHAAIKREVERV
jgi:GcrA cell cycle regulator